MAYFYLVIFMASANGGTSLKVPMQTYAACESAKSVIQTEASKSTRNTAWVLSCVASGMRP